MVETLLPSESRIRRITQISRIIEFGIGKLFFRMTARFSVLIFDVFPCDALPAAGTLKIRVIRVIRDNPRFRHSPPQLQSHLPLNYTIHTPTYQSHLQGRKCLLRGRCV